MIVPPLNRKLLAILALDMVGYSKATEIDEAGTIGRLRAIRADVTDTAIALHQGRIVKLLGDGALVVFDSVVDAVICAAEIQKAVAVRNGELPEHERIVFRIGINLGDVALVDGDVYGDGVNVAARIEQLADPGGVMVSGTAYDHLQGKLDWPLDFVGEQHVKNINRPVRMYRVRLDGKRLRRTLRQAMPHWTRTAAAAILMLALVAGGTWWFFQPTSLGAKPSVAVLPFNNYGDEASGRLADGLTEDIITDLARFPELDVVARNSTEVYKGKPVDARQVAHALHVGFVLEGSIQRQDERVRVTAQLIDAQTGNHLWSDRWDRPAEDVFAVQTEIAEQVSNRLGGGVGLIQTAGRAAAKRKRPENLNAYDYYLLGTEKIEKITVADEQEAIALLNRAIELDPGLARAWVELYHAHGILAGFGINPESEIKAAADVAEHAVRLDPGDAEAHAVFGMSLSHKGDNARAKAELDTALRLAPGSSEILTFYTGYAARFGEPERGAQMVDQVMRLDPNYPMWTSNFFGPAYFMAGRYEDALKMLERMTPDNYDHWRWVVFSGSLAALGRMDEANAAVRETLKQYPDLTVESMINEVGLSTRERSRFIETMPLAGFPACAKPEALAKFAKPVRLPECEAGEAQPLGQP
ncbi:MAG: adenylate/guanylate cyclase domain-containing protein [Mesorhizobium sp.]|uniref:adenylate/guanylate cyclase domain-containing protein n=1 Tax=unclassified Mesorhizobium TaxID=325217 RepID=UPI000F758001|nr:MULTISPECIES: adenylate/guanylate cyclase domain-containing protein [unclassified Mesorhizobium]AZO75690.1 adenylate/guanylate cyclase domain-containing protein [Mesorhizobium sp. M1D.F.Ca.ET.043.01.1.1]RWA87487.1 MAG: tetratricopeptide repeat protein [Mesorhizobium sp.]RWE13498.1 MAG: tetratricopeptide repeat protein [Mesorhizobium sp.]TJW87256.1 MAG: adenylate/guanylate cyclase domain-containing protein [Mesorhizobium sp.]